MSQLKTESQFKRMDKICEDRGNEIRWKFERSPWHDGSFCIEFFYVQTRSFRKSFCGTRVDELFDKAEEWFNKYDKSSLKTLEV